MYTFHLFFGLRLFITPIITKSFESVQDDNSEAMLLFPTNISNIDHIYVKREEQFMFWTVDTLYLLIGSLLGASSLGFLYYSIVDRRYENSRRR